jgi:hypothetical protein
MNDGEGLAKVNQFHWANKSEAQMATIERRMAAHAASVQAWTEDCERLKHEFGVKAAFDRSDEVDDQVEVIRDRIAELRAITIDGLKFKAKYASQHCTTEWDVKIMASIVDDILAL